MAFTGNLTVNASVGGVATVSYIARTGGGQEGHDVTAETGVVSTGWFLGSGALSGLVGTPVVADKWDIYWTAGGVSYVDNQAAVTGLIPNVMVGFSKGSGTAWPATNTQMTACKATKLTDVSFNAANVNMFYASATQPACITFTSGTALQVMATVQIPVASECVYWVDNGGITNPLGTNAIDAAYVSSNGAAAANVKFAVILDS